MLLYFPLFWNVHNLYSILFSSKIALPRYIQHISADTLRSISVLLASIIAISDTKIHPDRADAAAALVVSLLIIFTILPLVRGLFLTWKELQKIKQNKVEEVS